MLDLQNTTVQQIIPATGDMFCKGFTDDGEPFVHRLIGYALTVNQSGEQNIVPLAVDGAGSVYPAPPYLIDPVTERMNAGTDSNRDI